MVPGVPEPDPLKVCAWAPELMSPALCCGIIAVTPSPAAPYPITGDGVCGGPYQRCRHDSLLLITITVHCSLFVAPRLIYAYWTIHGWLTLKTHLVGLQRQPGVPLAVLVPIPQGVRTKRGGVYRWLGEARTEPESQLSGYADAVDV